MNEWVPVIVAIVINTGAIVFAYGRLHQTVADLKEQMGLSNEAKIRNNSKIERWEEKMEGKTHSILPECMKEFKEINRLLGVLTGKIDALIELGKK